MHIKDVDNTVKKTILEQSRLIVYDRDNKLSRTRVSALILSVLLLMLTFVNDPIIFVDQGGLESVPYSKVWIWFSKVLLFIFLLFFWNYVFCKGLWKLRFTIIYMIPILAVFLMIYPGIWRCDELFIIDSVTGGNILFWQHWLSSIFYYQCLSLIPIPAGIVLIQAIIICFVVGHIIERANTFIGKWCLLLYIPFLLPFVLDTIYYPLRASLCGFFELYFVFEIFSHLITHEEMSKRKTLALVVICAIISVWRPENIFWFLVLAFYLLFVNKYSFKTTCKYMAVCAVILLSCMTVQSVGIADESRVTAYGYQVSDSDLYTFSAFVQPFGELIKVASSRGEFTEELTRVDECISVDMICERDGIYAFWNGMKTINKDQLKDLEQIYIRMVIAYTPEFINERTDMLLVTNGGNNAIVMNMASAHLYDEPPVYYYYPIFIEKYYMNTPLDAELRKNVICTIEMEHTPAIAPIMYNSIPCLICIILLGIVTLLTKRWPFALITLGVLFKNGILYVTAAQPFYMYYFSTQLIGYVIVVLCIGKYLHQKCERTYCQKIP